ncbi:MAG: glycine--tRNA ligase [Candidatus Nanoarchaeia archaeon]|nr:glycine--tRNA ligase [Candidatus Nanoarchaeia archaeon]
MISIADIARFCKEKGFVYQNSEIYNPLSGFWDFGPLGVELKNNIKSNWWKKFVQSREDVVGIDGAIFADKRLWEASGHIDNFTDALVECKKCKTRFRADQLIEDEIKMDVEGLSEEDLTQIIKKENIKCSKCQSELGDAKKFNMMFKTTVGPVEEKTNEVFLRPETCGLIFTNFRLVQENARLKLPFGIAQIGKAFRNEISPRDFLFRCREFEQMEMEFFTHPNKINDCPYYDEVKDIKINLFSAEDQSKAKKEHKKAKISDLTKLTSKWHTYWIAQAYKWFIDLGVNPENLRITQHPKEKLAHYASACFDIDYKFPFGWKEIYGNADRGQYDLNQHIKYSKRDLSIFDEETKEKVVPRVASEPSQGVDRAFLTFIFDAYNDDKERGNIVLKLHPKLAPIKVGIFPLVNKVKDEAKEVFNDIKEEFQATFDSSGSVGRRYARADEIGIPYCVTYDFDTKEKGIITIRDRDTTKQITIKLTNLKETLRKLLNKEIEFEKAGKLVK